MTYGYIYKIQFPNGKNYIGLTTTSLEKRKKEHKLFAKRGVHYCIYKALRKHDMIDTFELIEIDTADTLEELFEKEIKYILTYNSHYIYGNGYNMTYGGDGVNGYVHTEEDNKKNSEAKKKFFENNPNASKEHSERMTKFWENQDKRQHMSEVKKKYFDKPGAREKCSESQKKRFDKPGAREKNSESQKKRFENPGEKEKMREIKKKFYEDNPKRRQEISEQQKKRFENKEEIKKRLDLLGKNNPFDVFKDGIFLKSFNYQFEAVEYLQKEYSIQSRISVSGVLAGKIKTSAGFVFKYHEK
jgi:flagellar biosynthesis GTPase FlhF